MNPKLLIKFTIGAFIGALIVSFIKGDVCFAITCLLGAWTNMLALFIIENYEHIEKVEKEIRKLKK